MISAVSWNKLKLVRNKGLYFQKMAHHLEAKYF